MFVVIVSSGCIIPTTLFTCQMLLPFSLRIPSGSTTAMVLQLLCHRSRTRCCSQWPIR
nr:MAG TPA: hypothetical protein [Crassvirales sp.]